MPMLDHNNPHTDPYNDIKRVILKKIQYQSQITLHPDQLRIFGSQDALADRFVYRIVTEIFAEIKSDKQVVTFSKPKTWWDHFKQTYFPSWLLKKYPVQILTEYKTVSFERKFLFPELYASGNEQFKAYYIQDKINVKAGVQ